MAEAGNPPPRRIWRIVLVVSLALNLAVAGAIGGALVAGRMGAGPAGRVDLGLGAVARALSDRDRVAIARALRRDTGLRSGDLRRDLAALSAALRADPFDAALVARLAADQAATIDRAQARAQTAVLARITQMTPAERRAFADRLDAQLHDRRPPRGTDLSGG